MNLRTPKDGAVNGTPKPPRKPAAKKQLTSHRKKGKSTTLDGRVKECKEEHRHVLDLATLNIGGFNSLTIQFSQFGSLTELYMYKNNLKSLPNLSCLMLLEILDASRNMLTTLENSGLEELTRLKKLDLNRNVFEVFPREIGALQELEVLIFHRNKLQNLDGIGQLKRLTTLDLSYNELTTIPVETEGLMYLNDFNLMENENLQLETLGIRTSRFLEQVS
jgi:Leucine-rich repeat (LRR) protein